MFNALVPSFFWFASPSGKHHDSPGRRSAGRTAGPEPVPGPSPAEVDRAPRVIAGVAQEDILRQLRSNDIAEAQHALQIVYEALFKQLWHVAYRTVGTRDLAEEMVQDVFLNLWEHRQSLVVHGALSLYLHVAIRNRAYDSVRHQRMTDRHAAAQQDEPLSRPALWPSTMATPTDGLAETEADRALHAALMGISDRDRDILILRWRDGWSFEEIARALSLSSVAARTVVTRQQRRLRVFLDRLREELHEP